MNLEHAETIEMEVGLPDAFVIWANQLASELDSENNSDG
jgi:hypothetical protein